MGKKIENAVLLVSFPVAMAAAVVIVYECIRISNAMCNWIDGYFYHAAPLSQKDSSALQAWTPGVRSWTGALLLLVIVLGCAITGYFETKDQDI
jgi:hypothetical protein